MIGSVQAGLQVSITGLGCKVPDRVVTNDDLSKYVDTSDEWIRERTGIRERRIAAENEALSDLALPAARAALEQAGLSGKDIDLIIVATVTPDMAFPSTAAIVADALGATDAAAYDLAAGCTGFMYALAQAYGMLAGGLAHRALVIGGDVLSKILDWSDRSTLVLFGDGAGAVVLEAVPKQGFLGFELGADGGGGKSLWLPGSGSRHFDEPDKYVKMNGPEVFKFATRILVSSAEEIMAKCNVTIDDVDLYIPHQANVRIIDHATRKLGVPSDRVVINVDRYGNTSSGSIPLAMADALADGRLQPGMLVLMTGMGAGPHLGKCSDALDDGGCGMKVAFCFPGQGSVEPGMGRDIAEAVAEARAVYARASGAANMDLERLCFHGDASELLDTAVQQPALVATSLAMLAAIRARGIEPDFVVGHSVGEFAALAASGAMTDEEAIALVRERGIAMAEAAARHPGSMAAILGLEDEVVETLCRKILGVWPANYNCPGQIVVSGENDAVDECCELAQEAGARRAVKLKVSGAFHSPLVARAADRLRPAIDKVKFQEPVAPFMSTVTARIESAQRMGPLLVDQLTAPVRFTQAASELMREGVRTFVEVGPGNVLSGLVKRIDRSVKAVSVNSLAALDELHDVLAAES